MSQQSLDKKHDRKIKQIEEIAKKQIEKDLESIEKKYKERIQRIKLRKDKRVIQLFQKLDEIQEKIRDDYVKEKPHPKVAIPIIEKICNHILGIKTRCELVKSSTPFVIIVTPINKDYIVVKYSSGAIENTHTKFFSTMLLVEIARYIFRCRTIPKISKKDMIIPLLVAILVGTVITKSVNKDSYVPKWFGRAGGFSLGAFVFFFLMEMFYRKTLRKHQGPQNRLIDHIVTYYGYGHELAQLKKGILYGHNTTTLKTSDLVHTIKKVLSKNVTPEQSICLIYAQLANKHKSNPYLYNYYRTIMKENNCHRYF